MSTHVKLVDVVRALTAVKNLPIVDVDTLDAAGPASIARPSTVVLYRSRTTLTVTEFKELFSSWLDMH